MSFILCPLTPPIPLWRDGALAGQGINRGTQYIGHSLAVDPMGQIIAGSHEEECVVWAEVNRDMVLKARAEFPALKDRVFKT